MSALDERERLLFREMAQFLASMPSSFNLADVHMMVGRYNELVNIRAASDPQPER